MVRWWRLALLVLAGAVTAVAAAVASVAGNVLTGSTAPNGFPGLKQHPWWWVAGAAAAGVVAWLLAWAAPRWYEQGRGNAGSAVGPNLLEIADGLAVALRSQWQREAGARGLNDPYPLPVAWTAADAS